MIIKIKKSRILLRLVGAAHLGAGLWCLFMPLPWWLRALLFGAVAVSCGSSWYHLPGRLAAELRIEGDGHCTLRPEGGGEPRRLRVAAAVAYPMFVCLTLVAATARTRLLLMRDSIEPETDRQLRARIAQRRLPVAEPQGSP